MDAFKKAAFLNEKFNNNMTQFLGIEYTEMGDDYIKGKMPVNEKTKQPLGYLHGGASVVFAESLGSIASNVIVDSKEHICFGMEINANHIRSVQSGFIYGHAVLLHQGKTSHIWDIKITNEEGELVCVSRLTVAVKKIR